MSSAPRGSFSSWVLPDGRLVRCTVIPSVFARGQRTYRVTADGVYLGEVVRWQSGAGVWRAMRAGGGLGGSIWATDPVGTPRTWRSRGDAVDWLVRP